MFHLTRTQEDCYVLVSWQKDRQSALSLVIVSCQLPSSRHQLGQGWLRFSMLSNVRSFYCWMNKKGQEIEIRSEMAGEPSLIRDRQALWYFGYLTLWQGMPGIPGPCLSDVMTQEWDFIRCEHTEGSLNWLVNSLNFGSEQLKVCAIVSVTLILTSYQLRLLATGSVRNRHLSASSEKLIHLLVIRSSEQKIQAGSLRNMLVEESPESPETAVSSQLSAVSCQQSAVRAVTSHKTVDSCQ